MKNYKNKSYKKFPREKRSQKRPRSSLEKRIIFVNCVKLMLKTAFITLIVFSSIISGYYIYRQALTSPYFQISRIDIDGNQILQENKVRQLLKPAIGQNMFRVNIQLVANRLRENSWIETAKVDRKFPNGLQVKIKERTPFAKIETPGGKSFLIDRNSFVIKKIENHEYEKLPAILSSSNIDYRIGKSLNKEEIKQGISFIEKILSLKKSDYNIDFSPFLRKFESITVGEEGRRTLQSLSTKIIFTERRLMENVDKLNIVSKIIQKEGLNVKIIDLTFSDLVVLKLV